MVVVSTTMEMETVVMRTTWGQAQVPVPVLGLGLALVLGLALALAGRGLRMALI